MKTIITNFVLILLSLTYPHLSQAQSHHPASGSQSFFSLEKNTPVTDFAYNNNGKRISLSWTMTGNEDTDMFELERSTDGKNFILAALLFGTDKVGSDQYRFYEKARSKKTFYRIKIVRKDHTASYSDVFLTRKGISTDPQK